MKSGEHSIRGLPLFGSMEKDQAIFLLRRYTAGAWRERSVWRRRASRGYTVRSWEMRRFGERSCVLSAAGELIRRMNASDADPLQTVHEAVLWLDGLAHRPLRSPMTRGFCEDMMRVMEDMEQYLHEWEARKTWNG